MWDAMWDAIVLFSQKSRKINRLRRKIGGGSATVNKILYAQCTVGPSNWARMAAQFGLPTLLGDVCFRRQSGHAVLHCTCLPLTQSRHRNGLLTHVKTFPFDRVQNSTSSPQKATVMTCAVEKATQAPRFGKIALPSYAMIALTLIGIADAAYVARGNYTGAPLWCPILDGCNTVISSPYSRVFGVPMSYFGFIYYLFMFGLAARLAYEPFSNNLRFRAVLYTASGAFSSIYFLYLQIGFIREICSYCLISAVTSFVLLFAALWHFQVTRHPPIN
jgi:uncharacterized membrane protein